MIVKSILTGKFCRVVAAGGLEQILCDVEAAQATPMDFTGARGRRQLAATSCTSCQASILPLQHRSTRQAVAVHSHAHAAGCMQAPAFRTTARHSPTLGANSHSTWVARALPASCCQVSGRPCASLCCSLLSTIPTLCLLCAPHHLGLPAPFFHNGPTSSAPCLRCRRSGHLQGGRQLPGGLDCARAASSPGLPK